MTQQKMGGHTAPDAAVAPASGLHDKAELSEADRWTPRDQPGGVYCSPRCGGRCKRADYERAVADAEALASRMGDGWKPRVWENLGWHWEAITGDGPAAMRYGWQAEIHPSRGVGRQVIGYQAWINPRTEGISQIITDTLADPRDALGIAMQEARSRLLRFEAELNVISNGPEPSSPPPAKSRRDAADGLHGMPSGD